MSDASSSPDQPDPNRSSGLVDRGKIIESFAPTGGRVLGIIVLVIGLVAIGDIVIEWRTEEGLTAALVVIGLGALVWMSMVRPAVALYDTVLVMRNFARDAQIPWHMIEEVDTKPVLTVVAGGKKYRSVAIAATGADRRAEMKAMQRAQRGGAFNMSSGTAAPKEPTVRQSAHTVERIQTVSKQNAEKSEIHGAVVYRWAVIELVVLGVAVLGVVITSLL